MLNDSRECESIKVESRRRTLLCCSTLCLFSFLILFLFLTVVFHSQSIDIKNGTISLNVIKFRSSLIQCGQSVVKQENLYKIIEELTELMKNKKDIFLNEELRKEDIIIRLEFVLRECYQSRQFSIIEQKSPTIIRQIISFIRKELLYLAGFFLK